ECRNEILAVHTADCAKISFRHSFESEYCFWNKMKDAASCHHECPDGSGYPDGIRREIPFMARIIAVADVFEALTV
ncbi:MAG: hypothetical protein GY795_04670, partial [Desulfobacterales bacterium]|nr:hypothetical protein [Desulfobacterales bacterium]